MKYGSLRGKLIVAAPPLVDPNFDRTVVLLLEHGDEGALGVVINRESETDVGEILPDWRRYATDPARVFVGGPVSSTTAIALATLVNQASAVAPTTFATVIHGVGTVDLDADPDTLGLADFRMFSGYAGWSPGQLEGELDQHAWIVCESVPGDAFSPDPSGLWRRVLARQAGPIAWLADYPDDPTDN